jgi:energy-coupling factor transporter ATP-binding protein EcfA2
MPDKNFLTDAPNVRSAQPKYLAAFRRGLAARLQSGSHLMLHGPRGSGKSTLLASMLDYYRSQSIPCAIAPQTLGLPDIVTALSQAYPETDLEGLGRRAVGARLRLVADRVPGVLLLDHTRELTTAMIGFLRHLHGGIVGALWSWTLIRSLNANVCSPGAVTRSVFACHSRPTAACIACYGPGGWHVICPRSTREQCGKSCARREAGWGGCANAYAIWRCRSTGAVAACMSGRYVLIVKSRSGRTDGARACGCSSGGSRTTFDGCDAEKASPRPSTATSVCILPVVIF